MPGTFARPHPTPLNAGPPPPARLTFVIVPRFNMATLITLIEPLRIANYLASAPLYQWDILSMEGERVPASNGIDIAAAPVSDRNRRGELIFVLASWGAEHYANRDLFSWLRRQARDGARICAVELGCYLLARAGLLAGRRVATHWSWAPGFQEQFPEIAMSDQLFTLEEPVLTCAGGLAGVDMMLRLISDAHGASMAAEVADQMLHHPIRPDTAPQRRHQAPGPEAAQVPDGLPPLLREAVALIEGNIADPLTVPMIAAALNVSQRHLERQFRQAIGCTVVQFSTLVRLQHARVLLISTPLSVREIATATGFNALSHFSVAFRRCFGRRPSDYRQGWPDGDKTPSWPGTLAGFLDGLQQRHKSQT